MSAPIVRLRVLTCGDSGVGKSSLIKRFVEGRFVGRNLPTVGVDFGVHEVPGQAGGAPLRVNFFDLSGAASYAAVRAEFYGEADALLLVYDVGSAASFEHLDAWLAEASRAGLPRVPIAVCGNKGEGACAVDVERVSAWAAAKAAVHCGVVSAATGAGVAAAFEALIRGRHGGAA